MSAPGTIRTRDLPGRNRLLSPLSYGGNASTLDAQRFTVDDLPPRMAAKIQFEGTCWIWTGALNSRGYSCIGVDGKSQLGHRVAYELLVGPIPPGLTIDHLCREKRCINPTHLEPVTTAENNRRKLVPDTCPKGHAMTGENLRIRQRKNGHVGRECRACAIEVMRAQYRRQHPTVQRGPRSNRVNTDAYLASTTSGAAVPGLFTLGGVGPLSGAVGDPRGSSQSTAPVSTGGVA